MKSMEFLIETTTQEKEKILKRYNITEIEIKRDVEIIKTWKEKQPHLPQDVSDDLIGIVLLKNKFSVEKTKQKLDNYYSLRGQIRDVVSGFENLVPSKHISTYLLMPKLTPNLERIIIVKILKPNIDEFDLLDVVKLNLWMEEFNLQYNYCDGLRYVCDYSGISIKDISRINPVLLHKLNILFEKAFSKRVTGVEFINFPLFASKILTLLKMATPPKIYDRIRIHANMESLYQSIPKEYLPVEYGGSLGNIPDLLTKWDKVIEDHRESLVESYKAASKEHLRPAESKRNESFGIEGTFKTLELD